jgi:hypothetical protein
MSGIVKRFRCRPLTAVGQATVAGVRKPPVDETAMGSGWRCREHYGDLAVAAQEVGSRRRCRHRLRSTERLLGIDYPFGFA